MNARDESELKNEFHLERIIFFSDAIFAIIITIMILDVKLPELAKNAGEAESKKALLQLLGKVMAYGYSFLVTGRFWMRHMLIYGFVKKFNKHLLTLNLLFLFSVSLFPFALSFLFSSSVIKEYSWGIYTFIGIMYFTFFTQNLLIGYLIKNKEELCIRANELEPAFKWRVNRFNYVNISLIVLLMIFASWFNLNEYIVFGAILVNMVVMNKLRKHYYPDHNEEKVTILSLLGHKKRTYSRIGRRNKQAVEVDT